MRGYVHGADHGVSLVGTPEALRSVLDAHPDTFGEKDTATRLFECFEWSF